ncbi:MAG: DUF5655 domain-containing protein [Candidatus Cloacimonadaceae bacterium]|nr:DUF5655 domain-containing protein [Candidatus Cloacimonadaceae bacterium]
MSEERNQKAWQSMMKNLQERTGKSMAEWIEIIESQALTRTSEKVDYLKKAYGLGHGYAGLIIYQAKIAQQGIADSPEDLLQRQFRGKEHLMPIYEKLIEIVKTFGNDVEIAPRNSYVSLSRNLHFAMLSAATKTRFDVALKLKAQEASGVLEVLPKPGMCTHRIKLSSLDEISTEVVNWLRMAYEKAR